MQRKYYEWSYSLSVLLRLRTQFYYHVATKDYEVKITQSKTAFAEIDCERKCLRWN